MTNTADFKVTELDSDELDRVVGGIIVVGGLQHRFAVSHQASALDRVALNPQPLPPKVFLLGH
ncbi:hypothetical protein [Bradyrhizobium sp. DOA9]|uniref:hypothetical protein n=1 Tax=Bradyrhizobium sp. DOA9 TaxID=1126627 RepID=UPI0012601F7C|nr:hypothetical protein [Bradyrhizobium sp. DOA9]